MSGENTLSVIVPVQIMPSMLTSSTVPEADYPVHSMSATYQIGDRVIQAHRIYESARANNIGKLPSDELSATWWLDLSATNRWRMFDQEKSSQTVSTGPMTVVIRGPGYFNALYLADLDAATVQVVVKNTPGGVVTFDQTFSLDGAAPGDWYEYWFGAFKQQRDLLISDLYSSADAEITVTLTGNTVKCGLLAAGEQKLIARTQHGATAEPKDYSYIATDQFGNNTIRKGKNALDLECGAYIDLSEANDVVMLLRELMAVPCVWILAPGSEYEGLRSFGLGKGKVIYDKTVHCTMQLSVKGLI